MAFYPSVLTLPAVATAPPLQSLYIKTVNGECMARRDDIGTAYRESIIISPLGRWTVTTVDFVRTLAKYNHICTLKEANIWIEHYQESFNRHFYGRRRAPDVSAIQSEQRGLLTESLKRKVL